MFTFLMFRSGSIVSDKVTATLLSENQIQDDNIIDDVIERYKINY